MRAQRARSFAGILCVLFGIALVAYAGVHFLMVRRLEDAYRASRPPVAARRTIAFDPVKAAIGGVLIGGGSVLLIGGGRKKDVPSGHQH